MKRTPKKLRLQRETLLVLNGSELTLAQGGLSALCTLQTCTPSQGCTITCGCPTDQGTSRNPSCQGQCTNPD
jgi:hypothetical protein